VEKQHNSGRCLEARQVLHFVEVTCTVVEDMAVACIVVVVDMIAAYIVVVEDKAVEDKVVACIVGKEVQKGKIVVVEVQVRSFEVGIELYDVSK
jgi:hypothetical protein